MAMRPRTVGFIALLFTYSKSSRITCFPSHGKTISLRRSHHFSPAPSSTKGSSFLSTYIPSFSTQCSFLSIRQSLCTHASSRNGSISLMRNEACLLVEKDKVPKVDQHGFSIVKSYVLPEEFSMDQIDLDSSHTERLDLTSSNLTLPIALMIADTTEFPSFSRARKACRKGNILIRRGVDSFVGRVGDRIYPGDNFFKQVRMGQGYFPVMPHRQPPFDLPVVYEDDHYALVNKPAGVVVYRQGSDANGLMSVRAALPFVVQPPREGTYSVLRRPSSVHRLDKPTSGLLCIAKTKPAMISMSKQFHDRVVQKTYTAIVNGIPEENPELALTTEEAALLGVDIDPARYDKATKWQHIDSSLDERNAVTVWRAVRYVPSIHATDGFLTLVELKPKTGRYHQLRRHMAFCCSRAILGDKEYDGGLEQAMKFRNNGMFLCASRISHEHPHFNSPAGRREWNNLKEELKYANGIIWYSEVTNKVMVTADIDLPNKFESLLKREERRFLKFKD